MLERQLSYFTTWSLILHWFHLIGVLPSTWSIAVFVMIVGTLIVMRQVKKMSWRRFTHINIMHIAPLLLIKERKWDLQMLVFWVLVYAITIGPKKIKCVYEDIGAYLRREKDCQCSELA